jgi:nucleoside transporter
MTLSLRIRLSLMMFLQYFMFGAWLVTLGTYMSKGLGFDDIIGTAYGTQGIAAIVSTLFVGAIADRLMAAQRMLGLLSLASAGMLLLLAQIEHSRTLFLLTVFAEFLFFVPTVALSNVIALKAIRACPQEFPTIRVVGTVGWISAGLLVGGMSGSAKTGLPLEIGAAAGILLGFYAFALPDTAPEARGEPLRMASVFGLDVILHQRERSFWVFVGGVLVLLIPLSSYNAYCNNFLTEIGARIELGGHTFEPAAVQTLGQASELVFLLLLTLLLSRLGLKLVLLAGMFAWTARDVLFAFGFDASGPRLSLVIPAILLHGVCYDFFFVASQLYVDQQFEPAARGRAQSFLVTLNMGVGVVLGSNLANFIYRANTHAPARHDWRIIWIIPGLVALFAGLIFARLFQPRQRDAVLSRQG